MNTTVEQRVRTTLMLALPGLFVCAASGVGIGAANNADLFSRIEHIMDERRDVWRNQTGSGLRDPDVSEELCPLVSPSTLDDMYTSGEYDMEYLALAEGDIHSPEDSERWIILGDRIGFSREVLAIYLAKDFCFASYNHIN